MLEFVIVEYCHIV